jgi:hypothetical protein
MDAEKASGPGDDLLRWARLLATHCASGPLPYGVRPCCRAHAIGRRQLCPTPSAQCYASR